jgi:hypothetical protein
MNNLENKKVDAAGNLAAAFGIKKSPHLEKKATSRGECLNIASFNASAFASVGVATDRLTFNDAAKLIRADGVVATDLEIDRMLARKNGVQLTSGKVLKDVWARGSAIPSKYSD